MLLLLYKYYTLLFQVAKPVVAVRSVVPGDDGVDWSDVNGPLIIILIVVPSALVIIATVILLYMHCYVRSRSWRVDGVSWKCWQTLSLNISIRNNKNLHVKLLYIFLLSFTCYYIWSLRYLQTLLMAIQPIVALFPLCKCNSPWYTLQPMVSGFFSIL